MVLVFFEFFVFACGLILGLVGTVSLVLESFETIFSTAMRVGNLVGLRMLLHAAFIPVAARLYLSASNKPVNLNNTIELTRLALTTVAIVVGTIGMCVGTFELAGVQDVRHLVYNRMPYYVLALLVGIYFSPFQPTQALAAPVPVAN